MTVSGTPVGRDRELGRLERFLDELVDQPGVILIEGEAGIGKTTLMQCAGELVEARGYALLAANPIEAEMPLEFAGLADLLDGVPQAVIDLLPDPQRSAVKVAVQRRELSDVAVDPRTIATAVLTAVREMASHGAVVFVVDDLEWLDPASARVLSFVLRRTSSVPVGLMAAVRTERVTGRPTSAIDALDPNRVGTIRLGPLSVGALRALLASRHAGDVTRRQLLRLHETSGGNPFFALRLVAHLPPGEAFDGHTPLPDSLRGLVAERVAALSGHERDVLLLSALSSDPTPEVVRAAAADRRRADDDLAALIRMGILTLTDGRLLFVHSLLRSAILSDASPAERRGAHRRLSAVVGRLEERLRHLALGAQGPDEAAAASAEEAATIAGDRGACETAAQLAAVATALTPQDRAEHRRRRTALEAGYRFEASDPAEACSLLEGLVAETEAGPARAELLRHLARYGAYRGDSLQAWTTVLSEALKEAGEDDSVRALILHDLAFVASNAGDVAAAKAYVGQSIKYAERCNNQVLIAQLCSGEAWLRFCLGEGVRTDLITRALSGPDQPARMSVELRPRHAIGNLLLCSDDLDGAREMFEYEYALAKQEGIETGIPILLWGLIQAEGYAGNWDRAESLVAEGHGLAKESSNAAGEFLMSCARAHLHAYRGRLDASRADADRAVELLDSFGLMMFVSSVAEAYGVAFLSVGDAAGAHQVLGRFAQHALTAGIAEPGMTRYLADEIEALVRLGEYDAAAELLDPFEARSDELGRQSTLGAAHRCRGLLLAGRGDPLSAELELDAALAAHRSVPFPFEEARTLLVAGEIHRRARHKSAAHRRLEAALEIFEQLGASLWARRARGDLDGLGIRRAATGSGTALTDGERRVADLAASGLKNSQIAAQLFMSRRTVEAHLSRVYQKLGVASRTEMARVHLGDDQRSAT